MPPSTPGLIVAATHHGRGGIGLVAIVLVALLAFLAVRIVDRRRRRREPGESGMGHESSPPSEAVVSAAQDGTNRGSAEGPPEESLPAAISSDGADGYRDWTPRDAPPGGRRRLAADGDGDWAVEVEGLTKRFGANVAVDNVDLFVPRGVAFGYLGPNGAGKTTLIRTLLGLTRADSGNMSLLGLPVPSQRAKALARVGAIVDEPRFHGHLSGRDNLEILAAARGSGARDRIDPSLRRVGLTERARDRVASYSMGMRQRLGVAACLLGDPELLILDEPMNGLDPAGMHEMRSMIQSLVAEGRTVMLSSHLLDEVERTCDAVAIVDRGRVIRQGSIDELVRGASDFVVRIGCTEPGTAKGLLDDSHVALDVAVADGGLTVKLPEGSSRATIADLNRRLVEGGVSVYRLEEVRTSLEDWFLSVTSRLGDSK